MKNLPLIIYYTLLILFVGLLSLPSIYTTPLYGQSRVAFWSILILLFLLPIYLIVLIIYGLRKKQFKQVLLLLIVSTVLICLPYIIAKL